MEQSQKLVLITGVTGYLASHVCLLFLQDGRYRVRATVRDKSDALKMDALYKAMGDENFKKMEIVEAELLDTESLERAVEGCEFVIHVASPVPRKPPKDENAVIRPAVEGTLTLLRASKQYGVKRVVLTSSCTTIMCREPANMKEVYTEEDWADTTIADPYVKSKLLAEQAAWHYLNSLPEKERFDLISLNPSMIIGPTLLGRYFTSGELLKKMLGGRMKMPGTVKIMIPMVDVRDAAKAHLLALDRPEARNRRFIISQGALWVKEIALFMKESFPDYSIRAKDLSYCPLKLASLFNQDARYVVPFWNRVVFLDNTLSREVLGLEYRTIQETLLEGAVSMIECGLIRDRRRKKADKDSS